MSRVVCIGACNVDSIIYVNEFCTDDQEKVINTIEIFSGGAAANIASGLGRLGKIAAFFGNIGNDSHTEMLTNDFEKDNVDYSHAVKTDLANNTLYSIVDSTGTRRMYAFNNTQLESFPEGLFNNTSFIIFTSLIKDNVLDFYTDIAKKAKARNIKVALDPGQIFADLGFAKLLPLLEQCDYFFPSINELNTLVDDTSKIPVPKIIITKGKNGVTFINNNQKSEFQIQKPTQPLDTTGAGDCFVAAFIDQLLENKSDEEAIRFAMQAAALSCTKKGARAMPSREEVLNDLQNSS